MAKKGAQKIQEEINTDEELHTFMERPGLLVLDIYSEWCGPCLGMVGALKKIKLEAGGDNLSLAICKSDNIEAFKRFRRKSEPTWLFVTDGKAVNIMFGTNTPKLVQVIMQELKELNNKKRPLYEVYDYQPEEAARLRVKQDAIDEENRIAFEAKEKKRLEYLMQVTDTIMENISDVGVTLFGPQVNRDAFKKLMEPADLLKIQCKDRKTAEILKEHFETINFKCPNPIDEDVLEQLYGKELLLCYWRVPGEGSYIPKILNKYAEDLQKSVTHPSDDFTEAPVVIPPILSPMDVKVEVELQEGEVWIEEPEETEHLSDVHPEDVKHEEHEIEENDEEEEEGQSGEGLPNAPPLEMPGLDFDLGLDDGVEEVEEEQEAVEIAPKKRFRIKKVRIPPIWVPKNHRTHAALIYVYFRSQTTSFLPPDPVPEPPHVIMAFDVYKKRDILQHAERHKEDVPLYGFFTSDQVEEANFICNSLDKYKVQTPNDKIVLKVNKATSHTMLSLISYGPSYVSPNAAVGQEEAKKFFPETYVTYDEELQQKAKEEAGDQAKAKSSGKHKRRSKTDVQATAPASQSEEDPVPESAPSSEPNEDPNAPAA